MSKLLGNIACGALGYVIGKHKSSKEESYKDIIKLEEYIDDFARRNNIYYHDDRFAEELIRIAEKYKE